jgi:hypothetical protein
MVFIKYSKTSLIRNSRQFERFYAHYDPDDHIAAISDCKLARVALEEHNRETQTKINSFSKDGINDTVTCHTVTTDGAQIGNWMCWILRGLN